MPSKASLLVVRADRFSTFVLRAASLACLLSLPLSVLFAQDKPAAQPAPGQPAAVPAAEELPAIRFAKKDLERVRLRLKPEIERAEATLEPIRKVEAALQEFRARQTAAATRLNEFAKLAQAKAAADQAVAAAQAELKAFEAANAGDTKGVDVRTRMITELQATAAQAAAAVAAVEPQRQAAEKEKRDAEVPIPGLDMAFKSIAPMKAPAEKSLTAALAMIKGPESRLAALEKNGTKADPANFREIAKFQTDRPVLAVRIDPSGETLLAGAQKNSLQRWDLCGGPVSQWPGHKSWIERLETLPDGRAISGADEGRLIWWTMLGELGQPTRVIEAHKGYVRAVALSPDRQFVATCGNDKLIKVWTVADGALVKELSGHDNHIYSVAFHPSGKFLYSGDLMGVVKQWDVSTWQMVRDLDAKLLHKYDETFKADCGGIRGMDFSPDGKWLACAGIGEVTNAFAGIGVPTVLIFECETGKQAKVLKPAENFQGTCWGVKFHPSGEFLVACGGGGSGMVWFWKPTEEKSFKHFPLPSVAYDLCFHPDGLRIALALYDSTARVYDLGPKP